MLKTRCIIYFSAFFLKVLFIQSIHGQNFSEHYFAAYSHKDGLSNNFVTAIQQDAYGYIWVATRKGLNRFDGNQFTHFYADSNSNSLPQDHISSLKILSDQQLAVITQTGLFIMDPKTLKGKNIVIPPGNLKYKYKVNAVMDVVVDAKKNISLLTRSGVYTFDSNETLIYRYDHYKREDVDKTSFAFGNKMEYVASEKRFIISTISGLYDYDPDKKKVGAAEQAANTFLNQLAKETQQIRILHSNDSLLFLFEARVNELVYYNLRKKIRETIAIPFLTNEEFDYRTKFCAINDSVFAITSKKQGFFLIRYDRHSKKFAFDSTLHFSNYHCSSLYKDQLGHIWIGTNRGLFRSRLKSTSVQKIVVPKEFNPKDRDLLFRSCLISNNKLFVGSSASEGIFVFDPVTGTLIRKLDLSKYSDGSNLMTSLVSVHPDTIYAGTNGPLLWINTRNYNSGVVYLPGWKNVNWVPTQFKDSRGNIYVGNANSGEFYFRHANTKQFELVENHESPYFKILSTRFITEDSEGNIWFSGHGVSRLNRSTGKFDRQLDSFPRKKTDRREIISPVFDSQGNMYAGLVENGIGIYNAKNNHYRQLTRSDGLPDNNIVALHLHADKLWIGSESGIASYNIKSGKIEAYGIAEDMPDGSYTGDHFYFDPRSSNIYGLFTSTIVKFDPAVIAKNHMAPAYFIERVLIGGDKTIYHPGDEIKLSYKENNLVITQASINFNNPDEQQYAYRFVENEEEPWQLTGTQKSIILSNLSPGKHRLQVKTFVSNNSWPAQVKEISIVIKPPFWQTTWFPILVGSLLLAGIYIIYRRRINRIHQKANIDKQLAELEIKGLHAQMNPHFIFNSLNSIKEMILENERTNASRYLSKFAQLIRTNLEQSRQAFITVRQCIDHLEQYLEMEKIRFEEFNYDIQVEDQLPTDMIKMAPMLLQPLVENAIWHGLKSKDGEKRIIVRFSEVNNYLVCEIDDNGIGIKQSSTMTRQPHRSLGISNIRQRLAVLNEKYGMDCSLDIFDKSELPGLNATGTLAILRITVNNSSND